MRGRKRSIGLIAALATMAATLALTATHALAAEEKVLHSFSDNGLDGYNVSPGVVLGASGNLYGTTLQGGAYGDGAVFGLTPEAGGGWRETLLHSFNQDGTDGFNPYGTVILDAAGNLYGTTCCGGASKGGAVFELSPIEGGGRQETTLCAFGQNATDGTEPLGSLVFDGAGSLYGTTNQGGTYNYGTVFKLTRTSGGNWTEAVLYSFDANDGHYPSSSLVIDGLGNLYGTTPYYGPGGGGTAFELTPTAGGSWVETILHSFSTSGGDGYEPDHWLIFDGAGNLYGTTYDGGTYDYGTVFELKPSTGGAWTEAVLHSFDNRGGVQGYWPAAGLVFDAAGNLFGTTVLGGAYGEGTVFGLAPQSNGDWAERTLYGFGRSGDGQIPDSGLIFDAKGNLYGTTQAGGAYGGGTVFEFRP
jgi:uncharacterized repeat protein (TIGR03803 family)